MQNKNAMNPVTPMQPDRVTADTEASKYRRRLSENETFVNRLNDLISVNRDAHQGHRTAANAVENKETATLLRSFGEQRRRFADELASVVVSNHGQPEESGNAAGALHRTWITLKSKLTSGDDAILAECRRGEEAAIDAYESVLRTPLDTEQASRMVPDQLTAVRAAYYQMDRLIST